MLLVISKYVKTFKEIKMSKQSAKDDSEQKAFEDWFYRVCPYGDAESVHDQWLDSSDYEDFCLDWEDQ